PLVPYTTLFRSLGELELELFVAGEPALPFCLEPLEVVTRVSHSADLHEVNAERGGGEQQRHTDPADGERRTRAEPLPWTSYVELRKAARHRQRDVCHQIRSATRKRALRLRGLLASSSAEGRMGRGVTIRISAGALAAGGRPRGVGSGSRPARRRKSVLTMRSSSEWKEMTASRPPWRNSPTARGNASWRAPNSSFTAMRRA